MEKFKGENPNHTEYIEFAENGEWICFNEGILDSAICQEDGDRGHVVLTRKQTKDVYETMKRYFESHPFI